MMHIVSCVDPATQDSNQTAPIAAPTPPINVVPGPEQSGANAAPLSPQGCGVLSATVPVNWTNVLAATQHALTALADALVTSHQPVIAPPPQALMPDA